MGASRRSLLPSRSDRAILSRALEQAHDENCLSGNSRSPGGIARAPPGAGAGAALLWAQLPLRGGARTAPNPAPPHRHVPHEPEAEHEWQEEEERLRDEEGQPGEDGGQGG